MTKRKKYSYCEASTNKKLRLNKRVTKKWEEPDIFKLISLVESEKCLWDSGHVDYNNKIQRDCAWRIIEEYFFGKYVVCDLIAKWSNLRIQYRSYLSRVTKPNSGKSIKKAPKWRYYNAMSFVGRVDDRQSQERKSNSVFKTESDNSSADNSTIATPPSLLQWQSPRTARHLVVNDQPATVQITETMRKTVDAIKESSKHLLDPNSTFCNYLLSELNMLRPETAASVRRKVTMFFFQCVEEEKKSA